MVFKMIDHFQIIVSEMFSVPTVSKLTFKYVEDTHIMDLPF